MLYAQFPVNPKLSLKNAINSARIVTAHDLDITLRRGIADLTAAKHKLSGPPRCSEVRSCARIDVFSELRESSQGWEEPTVYLIGRGRLRSILHLLHDKVGQTATKRNASKNAQHDTNNGSNQEPGWGRRWCWCRFDY